ncbi:MAG TPA: hypothetical protein DDZ53_01275 [Firmicutes bacterium]|mgnify:FL=1|jgi:hypothetical protein|nr:hypothetical protein [Bacillota bacterium]
MSRKRCLVIGLLLLLGAFTIACSNYEQKNVALRELLPNRAGFRWVYNGFAEYGHSLDLASITTGGGKTLYEISGLVDDPSGGEAPGPFDFTLTYQIARGSLTQTLSPNSRVLDNMFPSLELIRTPLVQGTSWQQTVTDKAGKQRKLQSTIVEVAQADGRATYTVRYEDTADGYWEQRVIRQGDGVVAVELPWEDFTIGYWLYDEASGYAEERQLNALLPPLELRLLYFGPIE